jgi:DNA-binding response OmpR family regulator
VTEKLKVLILDDSEIVLNMTAGALRAEGFEVFTASSLAEFDQVLIENEPDIVLTDIKMPETTGDNICRLLKQKLDKLIPIVIFSTLNEEELATLAERSGADGYVCKDSGIDEIANRIKALTEEIVF